MDHNSINTFTEDEKKIVLRALKEHTDNLKQDYYMYQNSQDKDIAERVAKQIGDVRIIIDKVRSAM